MEAPEKIYAIQKPTPKQRWTEDRVNKDQIEYIRSDLYEQLQKENAELRAKNAWAKFQSHLSDDDPAKEKTINQIKAGAVRDAVDIATRYITPAVSEMEVYIIRKMLEHAARLEGDK